MLSYCIKKFFLFLLSLFLVITLTFFIMKSIPGDPFLQEKEISKEILDTLYAHYGLDKPLHVQYFCYLKGFLKGDLGPSIIYEGRSVLHIIKDGFPISLLLGLEALTLSLVFGVLIGALSLLKKNSWLDRSFTTISLIGISLPGFLLATLLQYVLAIKFHLFPVARWGSFAHSILPALALSAMPTAFIAKLLRSSLIEVFHQDYIKTAYAKGLTTLSVLFRHALKNSFLPVISYLGPITAQILMGSFVIEKIFGIPGLGQWLILSISNRDYPLILGLTVFFSFLLITAIFIMDILYKWLDPRITWKNDKRTLL